MPDIAHWTTRYPIYMPGARNVYTVHDVIPQVSALQVFVHVESKDRLVSERRTADHHLEGRPVACRVNDVVIAPEQAMPGLVDKGNAVDPIRFDVSRVRLKLP